MVQEAVDLYKRKMIMREPMMIVAMKLFNLCEPLAGEAGPQLLVSVDQHEPHVGCSCGDGVPLNGFDLLSFLVEVGLRVLMNISTLTGPGLV